MLTLFRNLMLAIALTGATASAQFATVPGTGCPGALPMLTTGAPKINTTPTLDCPCPPLTQCFVVLGTPMPCAILPGPFCNPLCCIACQPIVVLLLQSGTPLAVPIPNDPLLVNANVCAQCFCISGACLKVSQAMSMTIQC